MKNYMDSDYALNKYSENIVYRFADGIMEVTLADYLAENPDKTEIDFRALKELSNAIYLEQDRNENVQTGKNTPFDGLKEAANCCEQSPEELFIGAINSREEAERRLQYLAIAERALDKLTGVQRRRYLLYAVNGLTAREIAEREGVTHQSVVESLAASNKKIKKILEST